MDTELTDTSLYWERRPPADLAGHDAVLWTRDVPRTTAATVRVVPDGSADIMWLRQGSAVTTLVAGPDSQVQLARLAP